jgi:hypothetical protein
MLSTMVRDRECLPGRWLPKSPSNLCGRQPVTRHVRQVVVDGYNRKKARVNRHDDVKNEKAA